MADVDMEKLAVEDRAIIESMMESTVRGTRDQTFLAAIAACEMIVKADGSAEDCVASLKELREMMNQVRPQIPEMN